MAKSADELRAELAALEGTASSPAVKSTSVKQLIAEAGVFDPPITEREVQQYLRLLGEGSFMATRGLATYIRERRIWNQALDRPFDS